MTSKPKKTFEVPDDGANEQDQPPIFFSFGGDDERDVTKPIGFDEYEQPLYAPRGIRLS